MLWREVVLPEAKASDLTGKWGRGGKSSVWMHPRPRLLFYPDNISVSVSASAPHLVIYLNLLIVVKSFFS